MDRLRMRSRLVEPPRDGEFFFEHGDARFEEHYANWVRRAGTTSRRWWAHLRTVSADRPVETLGVAITAAVVVTSLIFGFSVAPS